MSFLRLFAQDLRFSLKISKLLADCGGRALSRIILRLPIHSEDGLRPNLLWSLWRAIVEDFLDAADFDEICRPLNGILGSEGRDSGRVVGKPKANVPC
jgi:hypothetical protein